MMNLPPGLPQEKRALLESLAGSLSKVPHMQAIVLGRSFASGTQHSTSDLDIGLYYLDAEPFSVDAVRAIANSLSSRVCSRR
jgi:predicted nucleotidyltransferase